MAGERGRLLDEADGLIGRARDALAQVDGLDAIRFAEVAILGIRSSEEEMLGLKQGVDPKAAQDARAHLNRIVAASRELWSRVPVLEAALAAAETGAATAAFEAAMGAEMPTAAPGRVLALLAEIKANTAALSVARARQRDAISAVNTAEATSLEARARELEAEAARRQQKTDQMLTALQEFEGCSYSPLPPRAPGRGHGAQMGGAPSVVLVPTPATQILRNQAADLRREASALLRRPVPSQGAVEHCESLGALANALASLDAMRLGPDPLAVREWISEAAPKVAAIPPHDGDPLRIKREPRLSLAWRADGSVDRIASRVTVVEVGPDPGMALGLRHKI
ncbi:MAG: hypothetical protein WD557_05770 [Dehalococcoidia bacterium]